MAMQVVTKDTTALSELEIEEMAGLCADREPRFDIGFLTEIKDEWVLVSLAREGNKLRGYAFATLERFGGTPSLLIGVGLIDRNAKSEQSLKALLADQLRRALLAFPDEDVLIGTRLMLIDGYRLFQGFEDVVPRTDHKPSGEERAWARRLAKRFGDEKGLDDRTFIVTPSKAGPVGGLDLVAPKAKIPAGTEVFFKSVNYEKGHRLVAFGWAMAEDLASGKLMR